MAKIPTSEAGKVDLDAIKKAIGELESPKVKRDRERATLFEAVYPVIRDQLDAGVSKSAIVKKLADYGVSVSNVMFDELLVTEEKRLSKSVSGKETRVVDPANKEAT